MFYPCVLIKLSLISCVVGLHVDFLTKAETESKLADLEENINGTLNKLESNILNRLIAYTAGKVEASNQKTLNLQEVMSETVKTLDRLENELHEKKQIPQDMYCKERVVHAVGGGYNFNHQMIPIETLNYVTLRRNDFGVTDFKINIAIKAARDGIIVLSSKPNPGSKDHVFQIVVGAVVNSQTYLQFIVGDSPLIVRLDTPNILSSTHFKTFEIKIYDGKLEVNEAGNSTPVLTYPHADLKAVKYISFTTWGKNEATFRYDCPNSVY